MGRAAVAEGPPGLDTAVLPSRIPPERRAPGPVSRRQMEARMSQGAPPAPSPRASSAVRASKPPGLGQPPGGACARELPHLCTRPHGCPSGGGRLSLAVLAPRAAVSTRPLVASVQGDSRRQDSTWVSAGQGWPRAGRWSPARPCPVSGSPWTSVCLSGPPPSAPISVVGNKARPPELLEETESREMNEGCHSPVGRPPLSRPDRSGSPRTWSASGRGLWV